MVGDENGVSERRGKYRHTAEKDPRAEGPCGSRSEDRGTEDHKGPEQVELSLDSERPEVLDWTGGVVIREIVDGAEC
ncbi:hypothetical protein GCM10009799_05980 [Nocardiopsis rhodophaea]|uniref:Uncharacterized protein n=1 Tax=Nocardiopsis rhodophaea TaxID=280238 RepID=A0ABN2SAR8_9ACTN